jgi:hypothetical protein
MRQSLLTSFSKQFNLYTKYPILMTTIGSYGTAVSSMAAKDMILNGTEHEECGKAFEYDGKLLCGIPFPSRGGCRTYDSKEDVVSVTHRSGERTMHMPCHRTSGQAKEAAPDDTTVSQYV